MNEHIKNILRLWKIDNVLNVNYGSEGKTFDIITTDGREYYLKEKGKSKQNIIEENQLLVDLVEQNIPVPLPVFTPDGDLFITYEGKNFCLYKKLSGVIYNEHFQGDYLNRSFDYGDNISRLHIALQNIEDLSKFKDYNLENEVFKHSIPLIQSNSYFAEFNKIVEDIKIGFNEYREQAGLQLIHRNLHPGNMLFKDGDFTAYIDFEIAVRGYRIYDVCNCALYILNSDFDRVETRVKWLDILKNIVNGYNQHNKLTQNELKFIWYILLAIEVNNIAFYIENKIYNLANKNIRMLEWLYSYRNQIEKVLPITATTSIF